MTDAANQPPQVPPPPPGPGPDDTGPDASGPGASGPAGAAWEPPALTALAWRHGLVRPKRGRVFAGVCAALARATNTDPVLWRVILAVLTIFGFIGVVAYLILWLCLPTEGDTATPVEALIGRGRSGTSAFLAVVGSIIVVFALAGYLSEPVRATPLLAIVLLAGALLLLLRDQRGRRPAGPVPPTPMAPAPPPSAPSTGFAPTAAPATVPPTTTAATVPPSTVPLWAPAPTGASTTSSGFPPAGNVPPGPPFAPHGPFSPTQTAGGYPPPVPPAPPPHPVPPPPPRRPKERSRLGLLTFSMLLVVVGCLALVDLAAYVNVPLAAYFATALVVVGLGLVLGAWVGRARGLIGLGIVLTLLLGASYGAGEIEDWRDAGTQLWRPSSVAQIESSYQHGVGDVVIDLSDVDFAENPGQPVDIAATLDIGSLKIIVPQEVDVVVEPNVDVGHMQVFGHEVGGLDPSLGTVTDFGPDGPGGGQVRISASVALGSLEVQR